MSSQKALRWSRQKLAKAACEKAVFFVGLEEKEGSEGCQGDVEGE